MAVNWYYVVNGERQGPVTSQELMVLVTKRVITRETKVTQAGKTKWTAASTVKGLFDAGQAVNKTVETQVPDLPSEPHSPPEPPPQVQIAPEDNVPEVVPVAAQDTPVASNTTATPQQGVPQRRSAMPYILGGVAGFAFLCMSIVIAVLFVQLQGKPERLAQERIELKDEVAKLEEKINELKKTHNEHEETTKEAKDSLVILQDEITKKTKEKEEVEGEIARLTSYRDDIKSWSDVDLVVVNPTEYANGLILEDGHFRLAHKARGEKARDVIRYVRGGLDMTPASRNHKLARDIYNNDAIDVRIPDHRETKIREFYRPYRFVMASPDETPQFVTFFDFDYGRMRLGVYVDANEKELVFQPVSKHPERVPRERIREGSVRIGTSEQLYTTMTERELLDYIVLNVAHKLGSELDGKENSDERRLLLPSDQIDSIDGMYKPEYLSLAVYCEYQGVDHLADFSKKMDILLPTRHQPSESGILNAANVLIPFMLRKEIPKSLRPQVMKVEDEVYSRMSKLGLPMIENELPDGHSGKLSEITDPIEAAKNRNATHLVSLQIDAPHADGEFFLSARLIRLKDRRVLWATTGEAPDYIRAELLEQPYHMNSGDLGFYHFEKDTFDDFPGVEFPFISPPTGVAHSDYKYSYLVYNEFFDPSAEFAKYRMPFSKMPYSVVRRLVTSYEPIQDSLQVPQHLALRYAVCRSCSKLMPPAGRVLEVDGHDAIISLGRREKVKPDQKLVVFRVNTELKEKFRKLQTASFGEDSFGSTPVIDEQSFTESRTILPQEVLVKEVFDRKSRVHITPTGMEKAWGETAGQLLVNDIIVMNKNHPLQLQVVPTVEEFQPSQKLKGALGYNRNPTVVRNHYWPQCNSAKDGVINYLRDSLTNLNVPVSTTASGRVSRSSRYSSRSNSGNGIQPTHEIIISVQLSDNMRFQNRPNNNTAKPLFRVKIGIRSINTKEMVDRFEFDLRHDSI